MTSVKVRSRCLTSACYDNDLRTFRDKSAVCQQEFTAVEVPQLADGFPTHQDTKCANCYQSPIIGTCFSCTDCKNLNLCQNCYFLDQERLYSTVRQHKPEHSFSMHLISTAASKETYECSWCGTWHSSGYKCENCHSFYFCEGCYSKRDHWKPLKRSVPHKPFHKKFIFVGKPN